MIVTACNNNQPVAVDTVTTTDTSADIMTVKDIVWDTTAPAGSSELFIPSEGSMMPGLMYRANGAAKKPTLILMHGFPGNEKNLDLAQAMRRDGWNVVFFNYRGSWGAQGTFAFKNCVQDVVNVVSFCKQYADSFKIDTSRIALLGHSMGGWVCLKALQRLPGVKKGVALSAWDIHRDATSGRLPDMEKSGDKYFVLNKKSGKELFAPVLTDSTYHMLIHDGTALSDKNIVMIDEHDHNKRLSDSLRAANKASFSYEQWPTDHVFTNKRVALIESVMAFLDR
jgi:pimeloyl-ACP methyl ester carboxylesterase